MIERSQSRMRLCLVLLVLNLAFIWGNSLLPASASGALSRWVKDLLSSLLPGEGIENQGDGTLRKLAHFCEFCMLGILLTWLYSMLLKKWHSVTALSIGCSAVAACLDEMIQIFSPGRNSSILDVGLDTAGAVVGIGLLWTGYIIKRKKKMNDTTIGGK